MQVITIREDFLTQKGRVINPMAEFEEYAGFYDIINSQKDYESEVAHVVELIGRYGQSSKSILEFGCGTGRHGTLLAEAGFDVVGVDDSEDMLRRAVPSERFSVCQGDVKYLPRKRI